jgi:hypothetical protein
VNAVNLLAMMFAAQEAGSASPTQQAGPPPDGGFFWLLQQQALADSGLLAGSDSGLWGTVPTAVSLAPSVPANGQASFAPRDFPVVTGGSAAANETLTLNTLLETLSDCLRQILAAGSPWSTATRPAPENWNVTVPLGETIDASALEGQQVEAGNVAPAASDLTAAWSRVVALLNSRLLSQFQGAVKASSTALRAMVPGRVVPAAPWTLVQQMTSGAPNATAGQLVDEQAGYPLTADQDLLAEMPASVRWFRSLGLIGTPRVTERGGAIPVPLSAGLELPDGSQAVVRLSHLAPPDQNSQQQRFAVSIELPGENGEVLTATLTIQRLAPPISVSMPQLMPVIMPEAEQPATAIAASPIAVEPGSQPALIRDFGQGPTAISQVLPVAGDGTAMPIAGQAGELTPVEAEGYVVSAELLPGLKSTPVLQGSVPVVQAEQPAPADGGQPNRASWTVQMALDALNGTPEQPTILGVESSEARRQVPTMLANGGSLGTELSPAVVTPLASDLSTPQLMEFVGTRLETAQYAGLEYLELAQRIMERVSAARRAGNGLYNAHLDLNPPNLGKMFVNISVRGDAVALQIAVAATVPKEQLKDSLEALRQSLEDEGLYVVELQVHEVSGDEHGSNSQQQPDGERDDSEAQSGNQVVKTTPSLDSARKSTPALGFNS